MQPSVIYRELVQRGQQIASAEHAIDSICAEVIREQTA